MRTEDVIEVIERIRYKAGDPHQYRAIFNRHTREVTVIFERPDAFTGEWGTGVGGRIWIPLDWTEGDILRTVFGLFKNLEEHECREGFWYDGVQPFSPHITAEAMVEAARHIQSQELPR